LEDVLDWEVRETINIIFLDANPVHPFQPPSQEKEANSQAFLSPIY